jgi:hypothetical protein
VRTNLLVGRNLDEDALHVEKHGGGQRIASSGAVQRERRNSSLLLEDKRGIGFRLARSLHEKVPTLFCCYQTMARALRPG